MLQLIHHLLITQPTAAQRNLQHSQFEMVARIVRLGDCSFFLSTVIKHYQIRMLTVHGFAAAESLLHARPEYKDRAIFLQCPADICFGAVHATNAASMRMPLKQSACHH